MTESNVIDITDVTLENNVTSSILMNKIVPFQNDVQFVCEYTLVQNEITETIIISDSSDDENTPNQQTNEKPIDTIKKYRNTSARPINTLKRQYKSCLNNCNKRFRGDNMPPYNFGPFILDRQRVVQQYKHSTSRLKKKLRPIIIDGLNIGYAHGCGVFSGKGISLCVKYFENRGHKNVVAFIPQHRQGPNGSKLNTMLNKLAKIGNVCFTPSRKVQTLRMTCYEGRILLEYAHQCGGVVVSNDKYRDLYEESEAFKEIIENRLIMAKFVGDQIIITDQKHDVQFLSNILSYPLKI